MTSPAELHAAVVDRLATLTTVRGYDSEVPEHVPADPSGTVWPYAVVWPSAGNRPYEQPLDTEARGGLDWPVQVTVASGNATWTMQAADIVRNLLDGWRPVPGSVLTEEDFTVGIMQDTEVNPSRWWVPLRFTTTT